MIRTLVICALVIHVPLSFSKPSNPAELKLNGNHLYVIILEGICILLELFNVISNIIILLALIKSHASTAELNEDLFEENFFNNEEEDLALTLAEVLRLKFKRKLKISLFLLFLIGIVCADWFMIIFVRFSIQYYIPIRVGIVVMTNNTVRKVARGFFKTVVQARNAFIFYFSGAFYAAVTGTLLFRSFLNANQINSSFTNIIRAITTAFVYFSTGDNFAEVVYEAFEVNPFYRKLFICLFVVSVFVVVVFYFSFRFSFSVLYFVGLTVVGTYIVVAFVISSFLGSFRKEFHQALLKKTQLSRSGFFAAFAVMDLERTGRVSKTILRVFYDKITSLTGDALQARYRNASSMTKTFINRVVDLASFVDAMEDHIFDLNKIQSMEKLGHFDQEAIMKQLEIKSLKQVQQRNILFDVRRASLSVSSHLATFTGNARQSAGNRRRKLFVFLSQSWFSKMVTLLVLIQTAALTFYGLVTDTFLDSVNLFFVIVFFIEIVLKLIAYGPSAVTSKTYFVYLTCPHLVYISNNLRF